MYIIDHEEYKEEIQMNQVNKFNFFIFQLIID